MQQCHYDNKAYSKTALSHIFVLYQMDSWSHNQFLAIAVPCGSL